MLNLVLKVINMNKYIFGIFLFFTPNIFGQDLTSSYKKSFILELGMPIALTNKAFNNLMKPIIYFSSGYQYKLKSDFRVGGGFTIHIGRLMNLEYLLMSLLKEGFIV